MLSDEKVLSGWRFSEIKSFCSALCRNFHACQRHLPHKLWVFVSRDKEDIKVYFSYIPGDLNLTVCRVSFKKKAHVLPHHPVCYKVWVTAFFFLCLSQIS